MKAAREQSLLVLPIVALNHGDILLLPDLYRNKNARYA
jgi:hypothetical protein